MSRRGSRGWKAVVWIAVCAMMCTAGGDITARTSAAAAGPVPTAGDGGWPRRHVASDGAVVLIHEPQITSWDRQEVLTFRAAVAYTPAGSDATLLGTIVVEADARVSVLERLVDFSNFTIIESNFPITLRKQAHAVTSGIKASIPLDERVIALDRMLASLDASKIRPKNVDGVKADPPVVYFSTQPAVIVNVDGSPIWSPVEGTELRFAANTNWDLFEHLPSKSYYLRHDRLWLQSSELSGSWTVARTLPASFSNLPTGDKWAALRAALGEDTPAASPVPKVFLSTLPAELIVIHGEPQYESVPGTQLLWVRNTESDLFRLGSNGPVYYLVAGRWFSAPDFTGPWTFSTTTLPADFARIPLDHERSRVLASVPGTVQAAEAVLLAQFPQMARINRKAVKAPQVAYQGTPEFQPIRQTSVARAINTDKDIIKVGALYYMCFHGVWFMARTPTGPWDVAGSVPRAIYDIPISSPAHNVTYVTVEHENEEWVVFAAGAGYDGMMIAWGCAVWGTGWDHPHPVGDGAFYPVYFPHRRTYGHSAQYNPWTASFSRGSPMYGPHGGTRAVACYDPRTDSYVRGTAESDYAGRCMYAPKDLVVYARWGSAGVRRGDQWAAAAGVSANLTGPATRVTGSDEARAGGRQILQDTACVGTRGQADVYAGIDGNVYRKQDDQWEKFGSGTWTAVQQPTAQQPAGSGYVQERAVGRQIDKSTLDQLTRDCATRGDGAQRTRSAAVARSSASAAAASYRPSGNAAGDERRR